MIEKIAKAWWERDRESNVAFLMQCGTMMCIRLAAKLSAQEWEYLEQRDRDWHIGRVRAIVADMRDPPHAILDVARGSRMASGDALVFWNAMVDAILKE